MYLFKRLYNVILSKAKWILIGGALSFDACNTAELDLYFCTATMFWSCGNGPFIAKVIWLRWHKANQFHVQAELSSGLLITLDTRNTYIYHSISLCEQFLCVNNSSYKILTCAFQNLLGSLIRTEIFYEKSCFNYIYLHLILHNHLLIWKFNRGETTSFIMDNSLALSRRELLYMHRAPRLYSFSHLDPPGCCAAVPVGAYSRDTCHAYRIGNLAT